MVPSMRLVIPIRPMAYKRVRSGGGNRIYNPPEYRDWKNNVRMLARYARTSGKTTDLPVSVDITLFSDRIEAEIIEVTDRDFARQGMRGDIDNYAKAVLDALEGVGFLNDRQVRHLTVRFGEKAD
jgi:Holliday junction resolvase RusA-like endonuclease